MPGLLHSLSNYTKNIKIVIQVHLLQYTLQRTDIATDPIYFRPIMLKLQQKKPNCRTFSHERGKISKYLDVSKDPNRADSQQLYLPAVVTSLAI